MKIYVHFELELENLCQPMRLRENRVWKIRVGDFKKFLFDWIRNQISLEIFANVDVSVIMNSRILHAREILFLYYVIWR